MSVVNIGLHHVCKVSKMIFIMFSRCLERDSLGSKYALNRPLIIHGKSYSLFLVSFIIIGTVCPLKFTLKSGLLFGVLHNTEEMLANEGVYYLIMDRV